MAPEAEPSSPILRRTRLSPIFLGVFQIVVRVSLAVVFGLSGAAKIADPGRFARILHNYELMPPSGENLVVRFLPWIEILCAVSLLLGFRRKGGTLITGGLVVILSAVIASALWRGIETDCGCTLQQTPLSPWTLVRNAALLLAIAYLARQRRWVFSVDDWHTARITSLPTTSPGRLLG